MQEVIRHLNHTLMHLARATRQAEKLPETGGVLAARFMIVNSIESVKSVLELLRREKEETREKP